MRVRRVRLLLLSMASVAGLAALMPGAALAVSGGGGGGTGGGPGGPGGGGGIVGGPGSICWSPTGAGSCPSPLPQCKQYPNQVPVTFVGGAYLDYNQWYASGHTGSPNGWGCGTPSAPPTPPSPPSSWSSHLSSDPPQGTVTSDPKQDYVVFKQVTATAHDADPKGTSAGTTTIVVTAHPPDIIVAANPVSSGGHTYAFYIEWTLKNPTAAYRWFWNWPAADPTSHARTSVPSGPGPTSASTLNVTTQPAAGEYKVVSNGVTIVSLRLWKASCWELIDAGPASPSPCSTSNPYEVQDGPDAVDYYQWSSSGSHRVDQIEGIGVNG